jgi:hypothetical protein
MKVKRALPVLQHGQSLVEFLIIALVLLPFLLLLPMIAKYQDIAHATEMAGRYVAFDAAVRNDASGGWKPNDQLAGEARRRFFSNPDAPVKTNDVAGDFKAHQNLFWRDPLDNALIRSFDDDIGISFGETPSPDRNAGFRAASDGTPFLGHGLLDLNPRGIFRSNVHVTLANLPDSLSGPTHSYDGLKAINLTIARHTDLVIDAWTAADAGGAASHIGNVAINPGVALGSLRTAVDLGVGVMESPGGLCTQGCGPKIGQLDYWRDVVPADRIAH